jgi:hypothetical protein
MGVNQLRAARGCAAHTAVESGACILMVVVRVR